MPKLTLSMIVKNEEKHLLRCLSSVKDVVDEVVIVDTGSTDSTIEIAESFDAKIYNFDWINDFSAARNFALSKCKGNWILYLDADEELCKYSVDELLNKINDKPSAINCIVKSLTNENSGFGLMKYPRLFPNDDRIKFEGKVHEQIQNSLNKNNIPLIDSNIEIIHYGYLLDEVSANRKLERNLKLLLSTEKNKTNHYDTLRLAQTLNSLKRFEEAEKYFKILINGKSVESKLRGLAFMHYAILKYEINDTAAALDSSLKAFKYIPQNAYLNYLISLLYLQAGNVEKSFQYILTAVERNKILIKKDGLSENEIISNQIDLYQRALNLAIQLNDKKYCENLISNLSSYISSEKNIDQSIVFNYLSGLISSNELTEDGIDLLSSIINSSNLESFIELLKRNQRTDLKEKILLRLNKSFTDSALIKKNLALVYLNVNNDRAIDLFNESLMIEEDPSVYFQLISLYLGIKEYEKVKESYTTLSEKFSHIPIIKQKIVVLGEKLEQIFNLETSV